MTDVLHPNPNVGGEPPSVGSHAERPTEAAPAAPRLAAAGEPTAGLPPALGSPSTGAQDNEQSDLPPIDDPYLHTPTDEAPKPKLSRLAVTAVVAPLVLGPLGAIAGIVFGWHARRAIEGAKERKQGHGLATLGMALGIVTTVLWGAGLSFAVWALRHHAETVILATDEPARPPVLWRHHPPLPGPDPSPAPPSPVAPALAAPKTTTVQREGAITVVDVGISAISLSEALAKQRAEAASAGEAMVVMTTTSSCEPCRGVDAALRDPLMQTALAKVRLVRIDVGFFGEDLTAIKIPVDKIPGFYLLALDLTPRDGIHGGEWDEDIARNIAPVLGAFVRGKYTARREAWKPLHGPGIRL